jgi:predicted nucleic acid-binding protein
VAVSPGPRHLELFESLCRSADAAGDLAPDAQIAAIAVEHGCEVVSFDRDFARFADVRWSRP